MNATSTANVQLLKNLSSIPTYQAGVAQATAYRILNKFTESIIKEHDLTAMQWYIVGTIYDTGAEGITITDLSRALDTNLPYITNTINLLVSKDIVIRNIRSGDTRSKIVTIAPAFVSRVSRIEEDLRDKMRKAIYNDISTDELLTYVKVLYKINTSLQMNE